MAKRSKNKKKREMKELPCDILPKSFNITEQHLKEAVQRHGEDFMYLFCKYSRYERGMKGGMTISLLSHACTSEAVLFWLRFHIAETLAFVGIYDNTSPHHIKECARLMLVLPNIGNMKLTDLLHFFALVKAGEYGMLTGCHELLVDLKYYVKYRKL